ncbi:MAG: CPBP family intramembrane glutamic endopeptidase [Solirubrobacteraceae bacterium]
MWLIVIPLSLAFGVEGVLISSLPHSDNRDLGTFLGTHNGQAFMHGAWAWYGVLLVLFLFNTVLGEELLFRGVPLPRKNAAFGRGDWVANGLLFAAYHLHTPWVIPATLLDTFIIAYPSRRYRSAWIGIAIHSSQTSSSPSSGSPSSSEAERTPHRHAGWSPAAQRLAGLQLCVDPHTSATDRATGDSAGRRSSRSTV